MQLIGERTVTDGRGASTSTGTESDPERFNRPTRDFKGLLFTAQFVFNLCVGLVFPHRHFRTGTPGSPESGWVNRPRPIGLGDLTLMRQ